MTQAPEKAKTKTGKRYGIALKRVFKRTSRHLSPSAPAEIVDPEIDKEKAHEFKPTLKQQTFAALYLSAEGKGRISSVCRRVKMAPTTAYHWMKDPGFCAWFRQEEKRFLIALEGLKLHGYRVGLMEGNGAVLRLLEERLGNVRGAGTNVGVGVGMGGIPNGGQGGEVIITFEVVSANGAPSVKPGPAIRHRA